MAGGKGLQVYSGPCPENILIANNMEILSGWLCKFVSEALKSNVQEYTPHSLYLILAGFQRYVHQEKLSDEINILQDVAFKSLRNINL